MNTGRNTRWGILVLGALALLGCVMMYLATEHGVGLGFDSIHYISAARSLASGSGLGRMTCAGFKPLLLWPPLYPSVLAGFALLGLDALVAARITSVLGFGATVFLCGLLSGKAGRGWTPAWIGAALVLLSAPLARSMSWAMSESLYVPLAVGTIALGAEYLAREGRGDVRILAAAGIAAGAASLTRNVGVSLVIGLMVMAAMDGRNPWRRRVGDCSLVFLLGAGPFVGWILRNSIVYGTGAGRTVAVHIPKRIELSSSVRILVDWLVGIRVSREVAIAFVFLLACLVGTVILRSVGGAWMGRPREPTQWVLAVNCVTYAAVLLVTAAFLTPGVNLVEERVLVPLHLGLLLIVVGAVWSGIRARNTTVRVILSLGILVGLLLQLSGQIKEIAFLREDGQGFASDKWSRSPTGEVLRGVDDGVIFTNDIQAVYFLSGRASCAIPSHTSTITLAGMRGMLAAQGGLIVVFSGGLSREFLPIEDVTAGAEVWRVLSDSTVFAVPKAAGK